MDPLILCLKNVRLLKKFKFFYRYSVEPTTGFEPVTSSLPRKCSTPELRGPSSLERVMGVEPTPSAWKAEVLPLNYTRSRYRP